MRHAVAHHAMHNMLGTAAGTEPECSPIQAYRGAPRSRQCLAWHFDATVCLHRAAQTRQGVCATAGPALSWRPPGPGKHRGYGVRGWAEDPASLCLPDMSHSTLVWHLAAAAGVHAPPATTAGQPRPTLLTLLGLMGGPATLGRCPSCRCRLGAAQLHHAPPHRRQGAVLAGAGAAPALLAASHDHWCWRWPRNAAQGRLHIVCCHPAEH